MKNYLHIISIIFFSIVLFTTCNSQNNNSTTVNQNETINRDAVVANRFYSGNKLDLENDLQKLFANAKARTCEDVMAVISPHAGYVFSGEVAASAYNQIDFSKTYENVFVIGSSHTTYFEGASVYSVGNYETPLGEVKVNSQIAQDLIDGSEYFNYVPKAHSTEHSLEVQLPFLQYKMEHQFQIVPIVIGTQSDDVCVELASSLKPYFNSNNLFVISSDFSHYPGYDDANKWDKKTAEAVLLNSPEEFLKAINDPLDDNIPNLATRCCGWSSILTLLYLTKENPAFEYFNIQYQNSGDTEYGDKDRVVGYHAFAISKTQEVEVFDLSDKDKNDLLFLSRKTINAYLSSNEIPEAPISEYSQNLKTECGAFVTLNKNKNLRGCIGRFTADEPLYKIVQQMTIASASQDSRFVPVSKVELEEIKIEISVLSPLSKISSIDEIELGKHGIYIVKGKRTGTFLPKVAVDTGWTLEEFLGHCARDKAGIGWDGWKDAEIYIYEAIVFSE